MPNSGHTAHYPEAQQFGIGRVPLFFDVLTKVVFDEPASVSEMDRGLHCAQSAASSRSLNASVKSVLD